MTSIATLLAAISSAVAACGAVNAARTAQQQLEEHKKWLRLDRAYSHSPYRSESFQKALGKLNESFANWSDPCVDFSEEQIRRKIDADQNLKNDFLTVLNHWGRMASEVQRGIVDRDVAKELCRLNFLRFCRAFKPYICSKQNAQHYQRTLKLYDDWRD